MICPNCKTEIPETFAFCTKCGTKLAESMNNNLSTIASEPKPANVPIQEQVAPSTTQIVKPQATSQANPNMINSNPINYISVLLNSFIKPTKTFKEEEKNLTDTKNSFILAGIAVGLMFVINLIKVFISGILTKTMDYNTYKMKTALDFSGLQNIDWTSAVLKKTLIYIVAIFAIAGIYYIASLIFKKNIKFTKLLSASAISLLPYIGGAMVIAPILGLIWDPLCVIVTIASIVYGLLIFVNIIDDDLSFDELDKKIYVHLICLSILAVAGYYLYVNLTVTSIVDTLKEWW